MGLVDCGQDTTPGNVIEQHQARHDLGRPVSALLPHRPEVVADKQVSQQRILHYAHRVQFLDVILDTPVSLDSFWNSLSVSCILRGWYINNTNYNCTLLLGLKIKPIS